MSLILSCGMNKLKYNIMVTNYHYNTHCSQTHFRPCSVQRAFCRIQSQLVSVHSMICLNQYNYYVKKHTFTVQYSFESSSGERLELVHWQWFHNSRQIKYLDPLQFLQVYKEISASNMPVFTAKQSSIRDLNVMDERGRLLAVPEEELAETAKRKKIE